MEKKEIRIFCSSCYEHWNRWISAIVGSGIASLWTGGGNVIPSWGGWLLIISGLMIAVFRTWRDEYRRANVAVKELEDFRKAQAEAEEAETLRIYHEYLKRAQRGEYPLAIMLSVGISAWPEERVSQFMERIAPTAFSEPFGDVPAKVQQEFSHSELLRLFFETPKEAITDKRSLMKFFEDRGDFRA
jgi:Domain of unknown function (DUF4381)